MQACCYNVHVLMQIGIAPGVPWSAPRIIYRSDLNLRQVCWQCGCKFSLLRKLVEKFCYE